MTLSTQSTELCCQATHQPAAPKTTALPLRALAPTPIQPEWHHSGTSTLARLTRIEGIEVLKSTAMASYASHQEYKINIYLEQTQSHIPTVMWRRSPRSSTRMNAATSRLRAPDLQVAHSAGQFCSLRNIAHSCVTTDEHTANCDACHRLSSFIVRGDGRPMAFVGMALDSTADAAPMLTSFLNNLLNSCQSHPESDHAHSCRGQRRIAHALQEFLYRS